jgi:hypothetical protein
MTEQEALQKIQEMIAEKRGVDDRLSCARCGVFVSCEWRFSFGDNFANPERPDPKIWPANWEVKGWSFLVLHGSGGGHQGYMNVLHPIKALEEGARLLCPSCYRRALRKPGEKKAVTEP